MKIQGRCLCGTVTYEADDTPTPLSHCHCAMCRKAHGAAFRSRATIDAASFRWLKGETLVKSYESSPGEYRTFCSNCGSNLVTEFKYNSDVLGLPLGILDDDPGIRPECHVFVGSKAPWQEITDDLPQWDTFPASFADTEA